MLQKLITGIQLGCCNPRSLFFPSLPPLLKKKRKEKVQEKDPEPLPPRVYYFINEKLTQNKVVGGE